MSIPKLKIGRPIGSRACDNELGRRLAELRVARGLSQGQLGAKMRVTKKTIGDWETGRNEMSRARIKSAAQIFGVRAGWLAFGDEK
jgi:transcriptional regulator with XRE-family HTH domain